MKVNCNIVKGVCSDSKGVCECELVVFVRSNASMESPAKRLLLIEGFRMAFTNSHRILNSSLNVCARLIYHTSSLRICSLA